MGEEAAADPRDAGDRGLLEVVIIDVDGSAHAGVRFRKRLIAENLLVRPESSGDGCCSRGSRRTAAGSDGISPSRSRGAPFRR